MGAFSDTKNAVKALEGNGIHIDILWSTGRSEIKGNETADQLAKEVTRKAETLNVEVQKVLNFGCKKISKIDFSCKSTISWVKLYKTAIPKSAYSSQ